MIPVICPLLLCFGYDVGVRGKPGCYGLRRVLWVVTKPLSTYLELQVRPIFGELPV